MSHYRPERVGERLQEELAKLLLGEVRDPRLGFATVTEVRMSSDLRHARVFVSILGDEEERRESMEALRHASGFLRRAIGERVRLRHVPELHFELDETLDKSERIEELLDDVRDDLEDGSSDEEDDEEGET
ncbi:MAG: 30S ribosome-binding factor RbfA [Acidobacteriota bacterium]